MFVCINAYGAFSGRDPCQIYAQEHVQQLRNHVGAVILNEGYIGELQMIGREAVIWSWGAVWEERHVRETPIQPLPGAKSWGHSSQATAPYVTGLPRLFYACGYGKDGETRIPSPNTGRHFGLSTSRSGNTRCNCGRNNEGAGSLLEHQSPPFLRPEVRQIQ